MYSIGANVIMIARTLVPYPIKLATIGIDKYLAHSQSECEVV